MVELLRRTHQPDRALLDQVEEGQALLAVALGDRDDQTQVRLHQLVLRPLVAALDPLRQRHLLRSCQQRDLADRREEQLQRIRRDRTRFHLGAGVPPRLHRSSDRLDPQRC